MKIVFTGGGTGGHFYPIIAVAESVRDIVQARRIIPPRLYYIAPDPFDAEALYSADITYIKSSAGKMRRYTSIANVTDIIPTVAGICTCLITLFKLYPDVVFSKGGYASVPTVVTAWMLGIPIIIHESDSKPGRANLLGAKFASKIAITFESSAAFFPKKAQSKIARTGIPIRKALANSEREGAAQLLKLDPGVPTVLVLGGSSGSHKINETVLTGLPDLLAFANVIHQTGKNEFASIESTSKVVLAQSPNANRYHPFPYLSVEALRQAAGAADLVISRAGSTAIAEIALWKKPAIVIPIPEDVSHDQRTNAYAYAHTGAAIVVEEINLSSHVLVSEAHRILSDPALAKSMGEKSALFANLDAGHLIADELVAICLSHEPEAALPTAPQTT